jgi:hypothetical protein
MRPDDIMLDEVVVKPKREKYSRKNNPAVELMKKVIAHKKNNKLSENDYYQYNKYQKITMSLNDVTPEMLEKGMYKKMPFLKDQIELCEETNKFILPISVDETASQKIYRKHPKSEKTIIKGMSSTGVNELFATGEMPSLFISFTLWTPHSWTRTSVSISPSFPITRRTSVLRGIFTYWPTRLIR